MSGKSESLMREGGLGRPRRSPAIRARQSPHSLFLVFAALLFTGTLVVDLILHREDLSVPVLLLLMALCMGLGASALVLGKEFPPLIGLICVGVFIVATVYFLSPWGDEQSAVSSLQELPILALYLGWFVRPPLGRILMIVSIALVSIAMAMNPYFEIGASLGLPLAVHAVVVALFCFEVGFALWRRSERRVTTDQLTGALNRAGFLKRLDVDLVKSQRTGTPLCLVVLDFDYFKELNDSRGHAEGDRVLSETVAYWQRSLRSRDTIGRTGGDEFAILLDRTDAYGAQKTMKRLRDMSETAWSWGISQARPGDDAESLFQRADEKLYAAKRRRV